MAMAEYAGLLPELVLLLGALVLLIGIPRERSGYRPAAITLLALAIAAWLELGTLAELPLIGFMHGAEDVLGLYAIDTFAGVLKSVFIVGTAFVILASPGYMRSKGMQAEYYGLMLFAVVGMMIVASSRDFLTLFLGIEVSAFATYILAGAHKEKISSIEGATKYFITGALSSTLTLYGISLLYGITGSIEFAALNELFTDQVAQFSANAHPGLYVLSGQPLLVISVFMILAGIGFKFTMAPFHMWAPDAYVGAPDTVAAFLAGTGKGLGAVAFFKIFLGALGPLGTGWGPVVAVLAILTMTWGNIVAIRQDNIKRMLAYSSIAQAGYILIVLPVGTEYALAGGIFHTVTNLLMKGGAFLVVAAFAAAGIGSKLQDYEGLGRKNPILALSLTLFLLSLAGMPPLGGFWSKFVLFSSAVEPVAAGTGQSWLVWLAVAGILNSVISLWYYAKWIRSMYAEQAIHPVKLKVPFGISTAVVLSAVGIVAAGLWAQPLIDWSMQAAASLMGA